MSVLATEQMGVEFHGGNDQGLTIAFPLHPCRFYPAGVSHFFPPLGHCCPNLMKSEKKSIQIHCTNPCLHTLQVQVFGSCGRLCCDLGVNLDSVEVVGVPGNYDIVPVVVVQGLV